MPGCLPNKAPKKCALLVMLAPPELRKVDLTDLLKAFRRVCAQHGVTAKPAVVRYYAALIKDSLRQAAPASAISFSSLALSSSTLLPHLEEQHVPTTGT